MRIDLEIKRKCIEMAEEGLTSKEIYRTYFSKVHEGMNWETFRHHLRRWRKKRMADPKTLENGTYAGFTAHGATVQVNGDGEIVQAWIKQSADENAFEELLEAVREGTAPVKIEVEDSREPEGMLEIPLLDMHFPLSDHKKALVGLLRIIRQRDWEEINIVIGQDMFHNDDFRGRTSSGRPIEKVDLAGAWNMARDFWYNVISVALAHARTVNVIYSKGNHDESMSWAFVQMLKAMFPQIKVDDSLKQRKCIAWKGCFIGITHGAYKQSSKSDLRGQFTIQFATEFAAAKVREIHAGHLHREEEKDLYGVMVRRLCRDGAEDDWSDDEGYVGAIPRFMVFKWLPGCLSGIDYI